MSIFDKEVGSEETPQQPTQPQVQPNEGSNEPSPASTQNDFADLLGVVVNDKGEPKYSSVPEAMKGLVHSQEHIKRLESEMSTLRAELEKRASVEDALSQLTPKQEEPAEQPPKGLSMEDVNALLEQREQQKVVKSNTQTVVQAVQAKFGEKAEEVFYGKAKELGMTNEQFNQLAAQSPNAVLAFFNTAAPTSSAVNQSSINTAGLQPKKDEVPTVRFNGEERIQLTRPERSVLAGATSRDLMEEAARHKNAVFKKYGITY